ncbi:MAG: hypothetical protein JNK04_21950 [Myxococcales bacterium]|nr:hypothetical protein [Myxococcales bacterium]
MYHFPEGAIVDDRVTSLKSLHVMTRDVGGSPMSFVLVSETSDQPVDAVVADRLEAAELSSPQFRGIQRVACSMGGLEGVSFGWELFDEDAGRVAAHQIIARYADRLVSLSATFPAAKRQAGIDVMHALAEAVRWRGL